MMAGFFERIDDGTHHDGVNVLSDEERRYFLFLHRKLARDYRNLTPCERAIIRELMRRVREADAKSGGQ